MVFNELPFQVHQDDMRAILNLPTSLTSLSIWLVDGDNDQDDADAQMRNFNNGELRPVIQRYQDTLEHLEL